MPALVGSPLAARGACCAGKHNSPKHTQAPACGCAHLQPAGRAMHVVCRQTQRPGAHTCSKLHPRSLSARWHIAQLTSRPQLVPALVGSPLAARVACCANSTTAQRSGFSRRTHARLPTGRAKHSYAGMHKVGGRVVQASTRPGAHTGTTAQPTNRPRPVPTLIGGPLAAKCACLCTHHQGRALRLRPAPARICGRLAKHVCVRSTTKGVLARVGTLLQPAGRRCVHCAGTHNGLFTSALASHQSKSPLSRVRAVGSGLGFFRPRSGGRASLGRSQPLGLWLALPPMLDRFRRIPDPRPFIEKRKHVGDTCGGHGVVLMAN